MKIYLAGHGHNLEKENEEIYKYIDNMLFTYFMMLNKRFNYIKDLNNETK